MSVDSMKWVWRIADLDRIASGCSGQFAVLVVLADHATNQDDEDWVAFPSVAKIARRTRLSEKSVERHLQWLIVEGWISRAGRGVRKLGKGKFVYVLERDRIDRSPDNLSGETGGVLADTLSGERAALSGDTVSGEGAGVHPTACPASPDNLSGFTRQSVLSPTPPNKDELPRNSHELCAREAFEAVFGAFAAADKNAVERPSNEAAWERIADQVDLERLPGAAERYLVHIAANKRHVFGLTRWLTGQKWEPFLEAPATTSTEPPRQTWPGPSDLRDKLIARSNDRLLRVYLDRAGWDADRRVILAATARDAHQLRLVGGKVLEQLEIHGIEGGDGA